MELTNTQTIIAIVMIVVAITLAMWFLQNKALLSLRRRTRMMRYIGLDPDATDPETLATMKAVTARCNSCNCEDYCERWLDGEVSGSNDFCPNAQTFADLKRRATPELPRPNEASAL